MKKFVCSVCGYVHEGDSAPEKCPQCKVPAEKFVEQKGDMKLAAKSDKNPTRRPDGVLVCENCV